MFELMDHESEQSGIYQPFPAFLKLNDIKQASFQGNRFNVVFYNA